MTSCLQAPMHCLYSLYMCMYVYIYIYMCVCDFRFYIYIFAEFVMMNQITLIRPLSAVYSFQSSGRF